MESVEIFKKGFELGRKHGKYVDDESFSDFIDKHKEELMLYGVMGQSGQLCDHKGHLYPFGTGAVKCRNCGAVRF